MDHPLDLPDEADATTDQPDTSTTIQTITARLRDRRKAVGGASLDGAPADFPSPAPVFPKSLGEHDKPSKRRSSAKIVSTERLHNDPGRGPSTHYKCSRNRRQVSLHGSIRASWPRLAFAIDPRPGLTQQ